MIRRLRPAWPPGRLAEIYPQPHQHDRWPDHIIRVDATIGLGWKLIARHESPSRIADLSCGDAATAMAFAAGAGRPVDLILGDLAPGWPVTGPIEQTILGLDPVDLFICTETIEHLDNPPVVLARIREKTSLLLLSTPVNEAGQGDNPEHYWSWDTEDIRAMLTAAHFIPELCEVLHCPEQTVYQIWGCQ